MRLDLALELEAIPYSILIGLNASLKQISELTATFLLAHLAYYLTNIMSTLEFLFKYIPLPFTCYNFTYNYLIRRVLVLFVRNDLMIFILP